jgi:hypothetical protein
MGRTGQAFGDLEVFIALKPLLTEAIASSAG